MSNLRLTGLSVVKTLSAIVCKEIKSKRPLIKDSDTKLVFVVRSAVRYILTMPVISFVTLFSAKHKHIHNKVCFNYD